MKITKHLYIAQKSELSLWGLLFFDWLDLKINTTLQAISECVYLFSSNKNSGSQGETESCHGSPVYLSSLPLDEAIILFLFLHFMVKLMKMWILFITPFIWHLPLLRILVTFLWFFSCRFWYHFALPFLKHFSCSFYDIIFN